MMELKSLTNAATIARWEQLYAALELEDARADLLDDIDDIILSLKDIALIIAGCDD